MIYPQGGARNASDEAARWLLLVHQIPPKPDYFRVKVRRRLNRLGAVALKSTVYVLPRSDGTLEDFQWLRREISDEGGEAILCEARLVEGITDAELESMFRRDRDADYRAIASDALAARSRTGRRRLAAAERAEIEAELGRLRRRLREVVELDFFGANGRAGAEAAIDALAGRLGGASPGTSPHRRVDRVAPGRIWVTRRDVFVDRIASAWLIRAFIDAHARFDFVSGAAHRPAPGELRFDMFEAEYSHEGDRCTFETLVRRFGLESDASLRAIAEIVHDIDVKDAKFARPEAPGVERILSGITKNASSDEERLAQGGALFASLYESFRDSTARHGSRGDRSATSARTHARRKASSRKR